jgi:hypothetical protein
MDRMSIQEIFSQFRARFDQAVANLTDLTVRQTDPFHREIIVVREGYRVETLPKGRPEAPTRLHVFDDIEAFAEFVRRHWPVAEEVEIFLAGDGRMEATNRAAWGSDRVSCSLAPHLTAKSWSQVWNAQLDQRKAFQALHARRRTMVDGAKVIVGISQLEVKSTGSVIGVLDERGNYLLKANSGGKETVCTVPSSFTVDTPIFRGQDTAFRIEVDLMIDTEGALPKFAFVPTNLDEVTQLAIEERAAALLRLLNADERAYQVYRGALKLAE